MSEAGDDPGPPHPVGEGVKVTAEVHQAAVQGDVADEKEDKAGQQAAGGEPKDGGTTPTDEKSGQCAQGKWKKEKERRFSCPYCERAFALKHQAKQHLRFHVGRIRCGGCGKEYGSHVGLSQHRLSCGRVKDTTKNESAFKCVACDKGYSSSGGLDVHISTVHSKIRHGCDACGKEYNQKGDLRRHVEIVHQGIKRFKCQFCDKACSQKGGLTRHVQSQHLLGAKRSDKCTVCGKDFVRAWVLAEHMKVVHGKEMRPWREKGPPKKNKERFPCHSCDRDFSRRFEMRKHCLRVHGDQVRERNDLKTALKGQ